MAYLWAQPEMAICLTSGLTGPLARPGGQRSRLLCIPCSTPQDLSHVPQSVKSGMIKGGTNSLVDIFSQEILESEWRTAVAEIPTATGHAEIVLDDWSQFPGMEHDTCDVTTKKRIYGDSGWEVAAPTDCITTPLPSAAPGAQRGLHTVPVWLSD